MESLFVEDDILIRILLLLDVISLKHMESASVSFWCFTKRTKLWKKKFTEEQPNFFDNSTVSQDILHRERTSLSWDDHFKFKRLCLKYNSLGENWKNKNFIKKSFKISSKIGEDEKIMSMNSNFLLTTTKSQFFNTVKSVYDVNDCTALRTFEGGPRYQVLSADFTSEKVVMFGEEQLFGESVSHNYDYNFCIKLYSRPSYQLVKPSVIFHEPEMSPWSRLRLCEDKIVVFVSNLQGKDLNRADSEDSVHIFSSTDTEQKYIKHLRKIVLCLPPKKYLSLFQFDSQHIIGCRKRNTLVEVWRLESSEPADTSWVAPVTWCKDVSYGNLIQCSSVLLEAPLAFIGKSNGRCDVWDCQLDVRLRSLVHGEANIATDRPLLVSRILLTQHYLLTLTSQGKTFLWDRLEAEQPTDSGLNMTDPVWTLPSLRGNKTQDVFCDETKLVTLESGLNPSNNSLVIYDFWHNKKKTNYVLNSKRSFSNNSNSKKRLCN